MFETPWVSTPRRSVIVSTSAPSAASSGETPSFPKISAMVRRSAASVTLTWSFAGTLNRSRIMRRSLGARRSHGAIEEVGDEGPDEVRVAGLVAVVVGVAEAVVRVGERVPLEELAVGEEALPERGLDGRRRDVVSAAAEHARRAPEGPGEAEGVARAMGGLGFVAHRGIVEDDRAQLGMVGRERDQEPPAHAVAD